MKQQLLLQYSGWVCGKGVRKLGLKCHTVAKHIWVIVDGIPERPGIFANWDDFLPAWNVWNKGKSREGSVTSQAFWVIFTYTGVGQSVIRLQRAKGVLFRGTLEEERVLLYLPWNVVTSPIRWFYCFYGSITRLTHQCSAPIFGNMK